MKKTAGTTYGNVNNLLEPVFGIDGTKVKDEAEKITDKAQANLCDHTVESHIASLGITISFLAWDRSAHRWLPLSGTF